MTKVSIIIPVWNGYEDLADCLTALHHQTDDSFEVIAVDNGSSDGSIELIVAQFPHVHLIQNAKNLGFGVACNIGLRAARGDTLILLNQDTVVEPDWLEELIRFLEAHPDVGIVGSKAYFADGTIQHAGGYIDPQGGGHHYGHREVDGPEFDEVRDVDFVTGASLAIRRSLYEQIGGFDEGFHPAYYEDVDLCYRARAAGWQVAYLPTSRLIHKEESRLSQPTHAGMYLFHRNRLRFVLKHFSTENLQENFSSLEQAWLSEQSHGSLPMNAAMHRAYLYQLLNLADICNWRKRLSSGDDATELVDSGLERLAELLTELRTFVPYPGLAESQRIQNSPLSTRSEGEEKVRSEAIAPPQNFNLPSQPSETIQKLREHYVIQPYQFRSDLPIVGPLIAHVRRLWYQIAARWAIESTQKQQSQINRYLLKAIGDLQNDVNHLHTNFFHQFVLYHQDIAYLDQEIARLYGETRRITAEVHQLDGKYSVQIDHHYRLHQITREYLTECGRELADVVLFQGQK